MLLAFAAAALMSTSGCAYFKTVDQNASEEHDHYDGLCRSWLDSDVSDLIASWGQPTSVVQLPNGNSLYEWDEADHVIISPDHAGRVSRLQKRASSTCVSRFTVDQKNTIVHYTWNATYSGFDYGCR